MCFGSAQVIKPSDGPAFTVFRDPHLRLRRTLTPRDVRYPGLYDDEAQYLVSTATETTGRREKIEFSVGGDEFQMDVYTWGPAEEAAVRRVVAVHGGTPGISRTRFHRLGERLASLDPGCRFVAIDWHSIDRTDAPQPSNAFLTMLPKHFMDTPSPELMKVQSSHTHFCLRKFKF